MFVLQELSILVPGITLNATLSTLMLASLLVIIQTSKQLTKAKNLIQDLH